MVWASREEYIGREICAILWEAGWGGGAEGAWRDIIAAENIRYSEFLRAKEQAPHFKCLDLSPIVKKL